MSVTIPNPTTPMDGYVDNPYQSSNHQATQLNNLQTILNNSFGLLAGVSGGGNSTSMVATGAAGTSALFNEAQAYMLAAMGGDPGAAMQFQFAMEKYKNLHEATSNAFKALQDADANAIANVRG